jgi:DNA-binding HxlR family transcriptional regulator
MDKIPTELPVLRLALVGFSPAEQSVLEIALNHIRPGLVWRQSAVADADALFASGTRATVLPDGFVQLGSGTASSRPILIDLNDTDRPLAFSEPVASPRLANRPTFDVRKPESIHAMLVQFTGWLRPLAVQFWLASRIVQERLDLNSTVYHVSIDGRLQAVLSRRNGIGVLPIADPGRLADAVWAKRPGPADEIPGHFVQVPLPQVLWQYAMRTTRELLPTYFRSGPIYWCRAPQLPQRMFKDSHLMIVREIANAPLSFAELSRRTKLPDAVLARDLAGLRLVGSVTHDRKQAIKVATQASALPGAGGDAARARRTAFSLRQGDRPAELDDMTAPAPLVPQGA